MVEVEGIQNSAGNRGGRHSADVAQHTRRGFENQSHEPHQVVRRASPLCPVRYGPHGRAPGAGAGAAGARGIYTV
jgi:hypothetical protein